MRSPFALVPHLVATTRPRRVSFVRPFIPALSHVGCSSWVLGTRSLATDNADVPKVGNSGAEFMDEVEVDDVEWENEEITEGVFISTSTDKPEAVPAQAAPSAAGTPRRPSRTSIKHLNRLLSLHESPDTPESELEEKFVRGRGPGGQAINKTNSSVSLKHIPTGIRIQSQPTRSREQNRIVARQILRERLDLMRARGELNGPVQVEDTAGMSRKERFKAEARTFSKDELRWEKERRRKLNKKKKHKKKERNEKSDGDEED